MGRRRSRKKSMVRAAKMFSPFKDTSNRLTQAEICYNLRHVQLHGRSKRDPWSFRNFAVYHRYSTSKKSMWIFIGLPKSMEDHLEHILSDSGLTGPHPLLLHSYLLTASLKSWRWYFNHLEEQLQEIVCTLSFPYLK